MSFRLKSLRKLQANQKTVFLGPGQGSFLEAINYLFLASKKWTWRSLTW